MLTQRAGDADSRACARGFKWLDAATISKGQVAGSRAAQNEGGEEEKKEEMTMEESKTAVFAPTRTC